MKRILFRLGAAATLIAVFMGLAQDVPAQSNVVSDYASLAAALTNGATTITNFNPTNSPTAPLLISFVALSQTTFQITTNVTIDAGTNSVVLQGNRGTRFFYVHTKATLTLNNLMLTNGGSTNGGAIYNDGTLVISNCVLAGNVATNGSGASGGNGPPGGQGNGTNGAPGGNSAGGAIYSTGSLFISYSILTNNTSQAGNGGNGGFATGQVGNGGNAGYGGNSFGGALYSTGRKNVFFMTEFAGNRCIAGSGGTGGSFATNAPPFSGAGGAAGLGGSCAGGAAYIAGSLSMTNCLFFTNVAIGGSTGAAEVDSNGGGAEGSPGGSADGGALFITNSSATASIVNSIFFFNVCQGGDGGSTALNAAIGGMGGAVQGGGVWSGAGFTQISFTTLATNFLFAGSGGTNANGGINGTNGPAAGWDIYGSTGETFLQSSIVSFDPGGTNAPNMTGVTDGGFNISSDASLTKSTIVPTTKLNTNPQLDSFPTPPGVPTQIGGTLGSPMVTLGIFSNSPAQAFVPGVPGVTFPAFDQELFIRSTPTSAGAFEFNIIGSIPTNAVLPTNNITQPTTNFTGAGATVWFTNTVDTKGYTGLPFGYQWQFNGTNIIDNGNYIGTSSNILKIRGVAVADQGSYTVLISPTILEGVVTSSVVQLVVTNPPTIKTEPVSQINRASGSIVTFTLGVVSPLNFFYQWRLNGTNLPASSEYSGTNSNVLTIKPATAVDAGLYSVIVSNNYGSKTSVVVRLSIVSDHARPTVVIDSPKVANLRTNNLTLSGAATDNAQVTNVYYWITNINPGLNPVTNVFFGSATLTNNGSTNLNTPTTTMLWTVPVTPLPGTNILAVQSVDYSSNVSIIATRRFFYQVPSVLTLSNVNNGGTGTLTGHSFIHGDTAPSNSASLNIGEGYSIVAAPGSSSLLASWTNISGTNVTVTNGNTLRFVMESNTVIQATFVSNIFIGIHGAYNGLFYVLPEFVSNDIATNLVGTNQVVSTNAVYTNEVALQSAGMLNNLALGVGGTFSGRLLIAGGSFGFGGTFDAFGRATNHINRAAAQGGPLIVVLNTATNGSGIITGTVTNASWPTNASLWAHLSAYTPGVSNYTLVMAPPTNTATNTLIPAGYGYAIIANHGGTVTLSGGLADGTAFNQTVPNSISNIIPVYVSLYQKTGLLLGWLNLTNMNNTNVTYDLVWIKGTLPHPTLLFPNGFTNVLPTIGSPWTDPGAITLPTGSELSISNSDLDLNYTVSIKNNNQLANASGTPTNSLAGTINLRTGQLQVTFGNGDGRAVTRGFGVLLQDLTNAAAGYFTTKTNSGAILLEPTNQPTIIPENQSQNSGVKVFTAGAEVDAQSDSFSYETLDTNNVSPP